MSFLDLIAPGKTTKNASNASTQTHLRIAEIRDNILILKNGGIRAVLKSSSINFNLKSEQEQNAIIKGYQGFLNSLEFPVQIVIRSKKLDIDNYVKQIQELGEKQQNRLLQQQTYEYADYIKRLIEYADIMEKEFFVIVPYDPLRASGPSIFQGFFQRLAPKDSYADIKRRHKEFNTLKKNLLQRVNIVKSGLEQCSLQIEQLSTLELIKLFYNIYNPKTSRSAKLNDLNATDIRSDEEENSQNLQESEVEEIE